MKKQLRLYNVFFPIWFLFFLPAAWVVVLPANFLIDSLVLLVAVTRLGYGRRWQIWRRSILLIWGFGFAADVVGAGVIFLLYLLLVECFSVSGILMEFPAEQLVALPGVLVAGVLIYWLNRRVSFRFAGLEPEQVRRLAMALAVFTAPYSMLIPLRWIY